MNYTGSVPDTLRAADWRDAAACRDEDPELFFPNGNTGPWQLVIDEAKAICRRCPVIELCHQWAMENGIAFGVWGGLDEHERAAIWRRRGQRLHNEDTEREPRQPRTLQDAWNEFTQVLPDGHLQWTGSAPVYVKGSYYTPLQLAFELDRGRKPVGRVFRTCDVDGCVLAAHIADNDERLRCGTRGGYRRHHREGTPVCKPCADANRNYANQRLQTLKETA